MAFRTINAVLTNPEATTFFQPNNFWAFKGIERDFCFACDTRDRMHVIGIQLPEDTKVIAAETWEELVANLEDWHEISGSPQEVVAEGIKRRLIFVLNESRDVHREPKATVTYPLSSGADYPIDSVHDWRPLK